MNVFQDSNVEERTQAQAKHVRKAQASIVEAPQRQPTPWSIGRDGGLYDANGRPVRLSGLGTALNATTFFPLADLNRDFMLEAVNRLGEMQDQIEPVDVEAI